MSIGQVTVGVPGVMGGKNALPPEKVTGLAHWYNLDVLTRVCQDSAMTTPVASDGDPVGAWVDQVAAADELVQATTSAKPTYRASVAALGNTPALQFDGGDWLQGAFTSMMAQPTTHFVVAIMNLTSDIFVFDGNAGTNRQGLLTDNLNRLLIYAGTNVTGTNASTAANIYTVYFSGASSFVYVNGSIVASGDTNTNALSGLTLCTRYSADQKWLTGHYAEHIIYAGSLSVADKNIVQNYLAGKYGISVTEFS